MYKWIKILSTALLPTIFVGCNEHSLGGAEPPKEDVHINFSIGYMFDYTIEESTRATQEMSSMGIIGVVKNEKDSLSDCLKGLDEESFCHNMQNAEFQGQLPGNMLPADGLPRSFPLEEESAVAVYGYMPYKEDALQTGDTTCYIKLNLLQEGFKNDYLYTGKVFEKKKTYVEKKKTAVDLPLKHAFAKVNIVFSTTVSAGYNGSSLVIDTLELGFRNDGDGLLDLKNGYFYPIAKEIANDTTYSYRLNDLVYSSNSGLFTASTTLYLPPAMTPDHIKVIFTDAEEGEEPIRRILTLDDDYSLKMGMEHTISLNYNTQKNISLHRD